MATRIILIILTLWRIRSDRSFAYSYVGGHRVVDPRVLLNCLIFASMLLIYLLLGSSNLGNDRRHRLFDFLLLLRLLNLIWGVWGLFIVWSSAEDTSLNVLQSTAALLLFALSFCYYSHLICVFVRRLWYRHGWHGCAQLCTTSTTAWIISSLLYRFCTRFCV